MNECIEKQFVLPYNGNQFGQTKIVNYKIH